MEVIRETKVKAEKLQIGDRIKIKFPKRNYMATAIRDEGDGMLFLFDEYLDEPRPMNRNGNASGGYDESDMRKFLQALTDVFPKKIKKRMKAFENGDMLRLLTITEICGVDEKFNRCEGQIEWMKDRRRRIACRKDEEYEWGWTSTVVLGAYFANVAWNGDAGRNLSSGALGVRPAFKIINQ